VIHPLTPAEEAPLDGLAELADQDWEDLIERFRLHELAAAEPTFRGELL
jgi:hypothetical protein